MTAIKKPAPAADIGVRANHLDLFVGAAKDVPPSKLPPPKPQAPRWLPPKKNPNGGYDVRRTGGNEVRHFELLIDADFFFEKAAGLRK